MEKRYNIITVNEQNISDHPQAVCFMNPKNENYKLKLNWLKERFREGLVIKLIYPETGKRAVGFIEYTPGEYAWRAVSAKGYLFINCIWVFSLKNKKHGIGSLLLEDCFNDASKRGCWGAAVVASEGPFMAGKKLFTNNGFSIVDTAEPSYSLLIKQVKDGPVPEFNNWKKVSEKYKGLNIIFTKQCPWAARSITDLKRISSEMGLNIKFKELKTPAQAQLAPSVNTSFTFLNNDKILADHYISTTRFLNIIRKLQS